MSDADSDFLHVDQDALGMLCWVLSHNMDFFHSKLDFWDWMGTPEFAKAVTPATAYVAPAWTKWSYNASVYFMASFGEDASPQDAYDSMDDSVPTGSSDAIGILFIALHFLPILVVLLRIYSRVFVLGCKIRADDWWMMAAVFCSGMMFGLDYALSEVSGSGWHIWELKASEMLSGPPLSNCVEIVFIIVLFFIKLSFLAFYRTLYSHYRYQRALLAVFIVLVLGTIGSLVFYALYVSCGIELMHNPSLQSRTCNKIGFRHSTYALTMFNNVFLVISDFAVLCLFVPIVCQLKVGLRRRELLTVVSLFAIASLAPIAGILRTISAMARFSDNDLMVAQIQVGILLSTEVNIAVLCGSAPALKALLSFNGRGWRSIGFLTPFFRKRSEKDAVEMGSATRLPMHDGHGENRDPEAGSRCSGDDEKYGRTAKPLSSRANHCTQTTPRGSIGS